MPTETETLKAGSAALQQRLTAADQRIDDLEAQLLLELTDDLREILGRPNFTCHYIAKALRLMGRTIAKKSEDEQAATIHWMLRHYLQYGAEWRTHAQAELAAAALSASAEPEACAHSYANKLGCPECGDKFEAAQEVKP